MRALCLPSLCFKASMTGVNINMCHAPAPFCPPTACYTHPLMHKHFNTVLKQPLHTEASCLTSLPVIMTGPFSTNWHAHSLVTCHTPGCLKRDRAIALPHTDRWAVEWSSSCLRRRVALSDPSLCPIAWCDASTSANWPRAAGSLILPPVKGQGIRMQNIQVEEDNRNTVSSHQKYMIKIGYITILPRE